MIYVVATSQVKPEIADAFIKGAKECIATTRKEKGLLSYESHYQHQRSPICSWWSSAGKPARTSTRMARRRT